MMPQQARRQLETELVTQAVVALVVVVVCIQQFWAPVLVSPVQSRVQPSPVQSPGYTETRHRKALSKEF